MKTILVTGGAGYIGSHTVVELLKNPEYDVIIIDNFSNSNPEIINRLYDLVKRPIKIYHRDCRDQMDDILSEHKVDSIIHFAAYKAVGESVENPIQYYDNNINSLLNMLDTAKHFGIKNFVFSSSCALYGNLKELPATEESPLSEPESPYGYTKLMGERILQDFSKANPDIKIIALRYFNPAGADASGMIGELPLGKAANLVPIITQAAAGVYEQPIKITGVDFPTPDGSAIRDYVHVTDLAKAHLAALEWLETQNINTFDVFNIGTGRGTSVIEMIDTFVMQVEPDLITAEKADRRPGDPAEVWCDASKAKSVLGWEAELSVLDILKSAWTWEQKVRGLDI